MTTLKETTRKLTELYSKLNECKDGFTCNLIINDIEIAIKHYGKSCAISELEKLRNIINSNYDYKDEITAIIDDNKNIVLT